MISQNSQFKISVIIPIYNAANYIERCCESLFQQSLDSVEYIFVDDYSNDESIKYLRSIIEKYPSKENDIKVIRHEKNKGAATARNTGLKAASGKYIAWVDADDYIDVDMLMLLFEKAEKENADLVWCDFYLVYENYKIESQQFFKENSKDFMRGLVRGDIQGMLWNKLIKRNIFTENKIKFLDGYNMAEDRNVLFKALYNCQKIAYLNIPLYYYTQFNTEAITRDPRVERIYEEIYNTKDILRYVDEKKINWINAKDIEIFKFRVKQKMLYSVSIQDFINWKKEFSEVNRLVYSYKMSSRHKLLGISAKNNLWWIIKIWIFFKKKNNNHSS